MKLLDNYGIWGTFELLLFKIRTYTVLPQARLIRFPIDIRGKRFMDISRGFTTGRGCRIESYPGNREKTLFIGENFQMNDYCHITAVEKVVIGNNVLLASKIYISDSSHGSYSGDARDSSPNLRPDKRKLYTQPVTIEDNVWIGESVSVLPGTTIGKGSIIGANSVVTKNIPPNVIAVGAPAKPIKKYNFETQRWEKYINK